MVSDILADNDTEKRNFKERLGKDKQKRSSGKETGASSVDPDQEASTDTQKRATC